MKSSTLIASYLWRDTWSRWLEQPSSVLARLFVTALMVTVATVILVAFHLLERSVRARLEGFGLNTIVTREMVSGIHPEALPNQDRPDRLAPLAEYGPKLRLRQLFDRAQTGWKNDLYVMTYAADALPLLAPYSSKETPLICLSETWPENSLIPITLKRQTDTAIVRRPSSFFKPILQDKHLLLVPQGWAAEIERYGYLETTVFQREKDEVPMEHFVSAITALYALENRAAPQMQSPLAMIKELELLQSRQLQWRTAMAGLLGLVLALIFGSIAVLEFRQNQFVSALLRSFGAPARALYLRQWIENAVLANLAAVAIIAVIAAFHTQIFGLLGFSRDLLKIGAFNPYVSAETALILIWVNIGAMLSSIPVAIGLKKSVGEILN
ncbi:MAG: hypothetical protein ACO1QB_16375 [Verrucomicrobiales bacterium]